MEKEILEFMIKAQIYIILKLPGGIETEEDNLSKHFPQLLQQLLLEAEFNLICCHKELEG